MMDGAESKGQAAFDPNTPVMRKTSSGQCLKLDCGIKYSHNEAIYLTTHLFFSFLFTLLNIPIKLKHTLIHITEVKTVLNIDKQFTK